jgi:hypothetical protein
LRAAHSARDVVLFLAFGSADLAQIPSESSSEFADSVPSVGRGLGALCHPEVRIGPFQVWLGLDLTIRHSTSVL